MNINVLNAINLGSASGNIRRESKRRFILRLFLRTLVIFFLTLFIAQQYVGFATIIGIATLSLYLLSIVVRVRNEMVSDLLLTLGDIPALVGVVHLPAHAPAFEAVVPAWLIGTTIANLRKGQPVFLPLYSLAAWLVLATHASSTSDPRGYLIVQTLAVGIASAVALSVVLERRTHRTDALTGVLTRRAGLEELEHLSGRESGLTLAFVDLSHFKAVNDKYGHAVGDEVLTIIAKRLSRSLRQGDVLFRYGGDEFIVASSAPDLEVRLQQAFVHKVKTKRGPLNIKARIGVEQRVGKIDVDKVVQEADRRMYDEPRRVAALKKTEVPHGSVT